jgi:hypothetical protein
VLSLSSGTRGGVSGGRLAAVTLLLLGGCAGGDAAGYSRAEVKAAFTAEGLELREVGPELRSNRGFWLLVFETPADAERQADLYEGSGTLGTPDIEYVEANVVVYSSRELDSDVSSRVEGALGRLAKSAEAGAAARSGG